MKNLMNKTKEIAFYAVSALGLVVMAGMGLVLMSVFAGIGVIAIGVGALVLMLQKREADPQASTVQA